VVLPSDIPPPSTGYLIWHVSTRWRAALDRQLAPLGLTSAQYALLAPLYAISRGGRRPSQRELADFSGLDPMYVSKLVRALERAGMAERAPNPADSRAVLIGITGEGERTLGAARAEVVRLEEQRLAVLGGPASARSAALRETLELLLDDTDAAPDGEPPTAQNPDRTKGP
jgi:DNA-binding MarR family transcriptional regulator